MRSRIFCLILALIWSTLGTSQRSSIGGPTSQPSFFEVGGIDIQKLGTHRKLVISVERLPLPPRTEEEARTDAAYEREHPGVTIQRPDHLNVHSFALEDENGERQKIWSVPVYAFANDVQSSALKVLTCAVVDDDVLVLIYQIGVGRQETYVRAIDLDGKHPVPKDAQLLYVQFGSLTETLKNVRVTGSYKEGTVACILDGMRSPTPLSRALGMSDDEWRIELDRLRRDRRRLRELTDWVPCELARWELVGHTDVPTWRKTAVDSKSITKPILR